MSVVTLSSFFGSGQSEPLPAHFIGMEVNLPPRTSDDFDKAFVRKNGQTLNRSTYAGLWQQAQRLGWVDSEANWQAAKSLSPNGSVSFYSDGDGVNTFRIPTSGESGGFSRELGESNIAAVGDVDGGFDWQVEELKGTLITRPTGYSGAQFNPIVGGTLLDSNADVTYSGAVGYSDGLLSTTTVSEATLDLTASAKSGDETTPQGNYHKTFIYTGARGVTQSAPTLEQMLTAAAMPRVLHNTDMAHPVNQIGFDGNWSALAVDAQGWDLWRKYDDSRMFQVVEEGTYKPNESYILQANGVVIWEGQSPSAGHWGIALPYSSDQIDLRMSLVKAPWHPEDEAEKLAKCQRCYYKTLTQVYAYQVSDSFLNRRVITMPHPVFMRIQPTVTANYGGDSTLYEPSVAAYQDLTRIYWTDNSWNMSYVYTTSYEADATLKHADVSTWTVI